MASVLCQSACGVARPVQARPSLQASARPVARSLHKCSAQQNSSTHSLVTSLRTAASERLAAAKQTPVFRSVTTALGLASAALLSAQQATAASEVAQLAERDNRIGVVALIFLPVLGWVAFNIGGPALNQLTQMSKSNVPAIKSQLKKGNKGRTPNKRGIAATLTGLSILAASQHADAVSEVAQLADRDNRFGVVALIFLPVLGWVAFNIGGPALNQLSEMGKENVPAIKSQLKKGNKGRTPSR